MTHTLLPTLLPTRRHTHPGSGEAHQRAVCAESFRLLASLTSQHASAVSALHASHDRLAAQLAAQRDATLGDLRRAFESKAAVLTSMLTAARSGTVELGTVGAAADAAMASPDPVLKVRVIMQSEGGRGMYV
jgi:hypothetical protein